MHFMNQINRQSARAGVPEIPSSIMPIRVRPAARLARGLIVVLAAWLLGLASGHAQRHVGPFERLVGEWTGSGTIDLSNGTHEPLKCRAAYDVPAERRNLQINIRCASDSYNFNLFSSAFLAGRVVSGTWSESTHTVSGSISGTAEGDHIQVHAVSPSFSASLSLATHGNSQSVSIRTADPGAGIKGATIRLRRRG